MRFISLTRGYKTIVDDDDYISLTQWIWHTTERSGACYAARNSYAKGKCNREMIKMHRLIMGLAYGDKRVVDHINGNTLDNRRENLRVCSQKDNVRNRAATKRKRSSMYKGVHFHKASGKWRAALRVNNKEISLGYFADQMNAATAYNIGAKLHFGEFASLNLIQPL